MTAAPPGPLRAARRQPWTRCELVALDFETTGLNLRTDGVVSFGAVPVREGRIVIEGAEYREVAPEVAPSPTSIRIHELRPLDLVAAPPMDEVRSELADAIHGRFLLAWVAEIEVAFLARTFGTSRRTWARRTIDVKRLADAVEHATTAATDTAADTTVDTATDAAADGGYTLAAAAKRFGVPVERAHHAFDDALMTAELFLVLATRLAALGNGTAGRLLRLGRSGKGPRRAKAFLFSQKRSA
jgi:DNA polymerase-3 subunit epsilon